VDTVKQNGEKASERFLMLIEFSIVNSDGVFDSQDAHFSDVRIWQDLKIRMAFRQANELKSPLAETQTS